MSRQLPPGSAGRSRRLTSPIRSFEGRLLSAKPSPNPTPRKEIEAISIGNEAPDQLDDFWDDDKDLEQMIDEGIFDDEPSSQSSTTAAESAVMPEPREGTQTDTLVRERTAPAWTSPPPEDIDRGNSVGPRKKPRIAVTQGKSVWAPTANTTDNKSTFSVADATPLSLQDAAQLNHTPEYDPLSGLRIRDRTVPCEVVAGLTKDTTTIPLMDEAHIREHCQHASRSGLLPSNTRPMVSLGKLPSESKGTEGDTDEKQSSTPWLIAGVVGAKSPKRMTARKSPYCHFQLSDLRRGIVNVFMFRSVMEKHYDQIQPGDIVVILEPKVLDLAERSGVLGTEVDHPNRLLVLGVSMDFGQCEAVKMNGQNCGKVLDKRGSIYCMQHIMMAANKQRNQRGSLIVGTSSIYDLNTNPGPGSRDSSHGPRSQHAFVGQKKKIERDSSGATYLLGDGEVATSSQTSLAAGGSKRLQQTDDTLSTYLMSQNNLGGQYLKQAMSSKDVAWAKDITSPKKAPAENSELFPAEMVRRMGYDPVTGKFVPGSPKRSDDDPEARERSIRLLAERIKSPPRAISPLAALFHAQGKGASRGRTEGGRSNPANSLLMGRRRAGSPTPSPAVTRTATSSQPQQNTGSKQWVDLTDDSGDDSDDGPRLPSLAQQRAKNLRDAAKRKGTSQKR
ncbi:hypothetical protein BGW38_000482 [Lunasporangiospora selenospora]|uniref:Zinc finger Mcm10/DnaG-type domain-containing protein n=1 Tax=Lunasporangiospora selenospora TaxID=979761 RepID=A0A9P6G3W3_9FUNG|nr:hypothetical protein BGW38_000482 [Lunasporangiospora selenospora]